MQKFIEALGGGLVTSKDPSTLQPGELTAAIDCMYYQDNPHLARIPGVSQWSQVNSGGNITGLVGCKFNSGTHKLVAQVSATATNTTSYYMADAETNGSTFTTAVTGLTGGEQLVSVQHNNKYYLFNGVDQNLVLLSDGTFRPHGLNPAIAGGMRWVDWMDDPNAFDPFPTAPASVQASGYYEYWYTEVVKFPNGDEIESAFDGVPITLEIPAHLHAPVFELPKNPANKNLVTDYGATLKYNVYRSEKKALQSNKMYPIGRKCGEANYVTSSGINESIVYFKDKATDANTGAKTSGTFIGAYVSTFSKVDGNSANQYTQLAVVPSTGTVTDCLSGTGTVKFTLVKGPSGWHDGTNGSWPANMSSSKFRSAAFSAGIRLKNFSFGSISGNISGIDVELYGKCSTVGAASVTVMPAVYNASSNAPENIPAQGGSPARAGGAFYYTPQNLPPNGYPTYDSLLTSVSIFAQTKTIIDTSFTTQHFGKSNGIAPPYFLTSPYQWSIANITNNFGVDVLVDFGSAFYNSTSPVYYELDTLSMNIYYDKTWSEDDPDTKYYDSVKVSQAGVSLSFGANGKPPIASTGVMFDGCLVTNQVDTPQRIVYSMPDYPDSMPKDIYWLDLPAEDNDKITAVAVINDKLIVGMRNSLWRVNYLPSQEDASFARGEAFSLVSSIVGIVNTRALCKFTNAGGQQELAFVDSNGVFSTDGYNIRKLSQDLLWVGASNRAVITASTTQNVPSKILALINDPRTQTIRLITNSGWGWAGSYAAIHNKPGTGIKWTKYYTTNNVDVSGSVYGANVNRATVIRRNNGVWIVVYGFLVGTNAVVGGHVVREDSADTTTYNLPMNAINAYPTIATREISVVGPGNEMSVDGVGIHGTNKLSQSSNQYYNIGATVNATQLFTNAGTSLSETSIPGNVANSRMSYAGIDGINTESVLFNFQLSAQGMFEIHAILLDIDNFREADISA